MKRLSVALTFPLLLSLACRDEATELGGDLAWNTPAADFGAVPLGGVEERVLSLTNGTDAPATPQLEVRGRGFEGAAGEVTLAPGEEVLLLVRFRPGDAGAVEGALSAVWAGRAETVRLTGTGVQGDLRVSPERLDLGSVVVGRTRSATVTVENVGAFSARVEPRASAALPACADATPDTSFCLVRPAGAQVPAGGTARFEIRFRPEAPVRHFAQLELRCPACDRTTVNVQGFGLARSLECPERLDLRTLRPRVRVDATLEASVRCANVGHEPLTIRSLSWNGDLGFSSDADVPFVVAPGAEFDIPVRFTPARFGDHAATLRVGAGPPVPDEGVEIAVIGVGGGPALVVTPNPVEVGDVPVRSEARARFALTNRGDQPLTVSAIEVDLRPTAVDLTLAPGARRTMEAAFVSPAAAGRFALPLTFVSNDPFVPPYEVQGAARSYPVCRLDVPARVDLGAAAPYRPVVGQVGLRNVGPEDCVVLGARLSLEAGADYRLPSPAPTPLVFSPGSTAPIWVEADPRVGTSTAVVQISTSAGSVEVPVSADADPEALLLSPAAVDFGAHDPSCGPATETVRVYATSALLARLIDVRVEGAGFSLVDGPDLSGGALFIRKGVETPVTVGFRAPSAGLHTGALVVRSGSFDGSERVQRVPLRGLGAPAPSVTERFVQVERAALDLLFVVDFSGCTGQERNSLGVHYENLMRVVHAAGLDARIGATSTGIAQQDGRLFHPRAPFGPGYDGPFENRIIDPAQPDAAELFARAMLAISEYGGSAADESARGAAYRALSPDRLDVDNAGFLRRDAHLTVVMLQDEPDQTDVLDDPRLPGQGVGVFRDAFWALKGHAGRDAVSVVSIAGDVPAGCTGPGGTAAAAPQMVQLARETHGAFQSVCAMGPTDLDALAGPLAGERDAFWLKQTPDPATLAVSVDGALVPRNAWTYDGTDRSVRLSAAVVPEAGAVIDVEYAPVCVTP